MIRNTIEMEGATLGIGDSAYIDCPACGRQKKMGITRNHEGILFNCFSTNCGERGFIGSFGEYTSANLEVRDKVLKNPRWVGVPCPLDTEDLWFFVRAFGLKITGPSVSGVQMVDFQATPHDEYLFPIHNADGRRVGEVIRQPVWSHKDCHRVGRPWLPKAKTYIEAGESKLDFYPGSIDPDILVLVEDQISAAKVNQVTGFTAVALLGNNIPDKDVMALARRAPKTVYLWLDPDMREHAYQVAGRVGGMFKDFRVLQSDEDPKEMDAQEIREILSE